MLLVFTALPEQAVRLPGRPDARGSAQRATDRGPERHPRPAHRLRPAQALRPRGGGQRKLRARRQVLPRGTSTCVLFVCVLLSKV